MYVQPVELHNIEYRIVKHRNQTKDRNQRAETYT
jgi:hypothetical protein